MGEIEKLNKKIFILVFVLIVGTLTLGVITNNPFLVAPIAILLWLVIVAHVIKYLSMLFKGNDSKDEDEK